MITKRWTVIGYYADNDERACFWVTSWDAEGAEEKAIWAGKRRGGDFRPCGVVAGHVNAHDKKHYTVGGV